jgi:hypothetical protein
MQPLPNTWGPYKSFYTTTSAFKRHVKAKHYDVPFNEHSEKVMIEDLRAWVAVETGTSTPESTPWTKAAQGSYVRQPGERFTAGKYRALLAEFIVESSSSFRIVEYSSFHRFLSFLYKNFPLVSPETVRKDTTELKNRYQTKVHGKIQSHVGAKGRISLTIDAWMSGNQIPNLGVTGHWINSSWNVGNEALAFKRLPGSHTAENIAAVVQRIMAE